MFFSFNRRNGHTPKILVIHTMGPYRTVLNPIELTLFDPIQSLWNPMDPYETLYIYLETHYTDPI